MSCAVHLGTRNGSLCLSTLNKCHYTRSLTRQLSLSLSLSLILLANCERVFTHEWRSASLVYSKYIQSCLFPWPNRTLLLGYTIKIVFKLNALLGHLPVLLARLILRIRRAFQAGMLLTMLLSWL